jgi:hypothetical protein
MITVVLSLGLPVSFFSIDALSTRYTGGGPAGPGAATGAAGTATTAAGLSHAAKLNAPSIAKVRSERFMGNPLKAPSGQAHS